MFGTPIARCMSLATIARPLALCAASTAQLFDPINAACSSNVFRPPFTSAATGGARRSATLAVGLVVVALTFVRGPLVRFLDLQEDADHWDEEDERAQAVEVLQPPSDHDETEEVRGRVLPLRRPS